jgi:UDP-glucose-4-epimerase GalE
MRILVTGGAGYIGSHVGRALTARADEIVVIDDLSTGHRELVPPGAPLVVESILNTPRLAEILCAERIEAIMHFAALSTVGEDARHPARYWEVNVGGTLSILDAMVRSGVSRIVFSSSCSVYGQPDQLPVTESAARRPISVYGETKMAMENAIRAHGDRYGILWAALRYFNAAGASSDGTTGERHEPETHLLPNTIRAALGRGAPLTLHGEDYPTPDGTPIRDYIHVEDLAEAHVAALGLEGSGAFNLGTGAGTSVKEIVSMVERVTGRPVPRSIGPRRPGDPARLVAGYELARRALGWNPKRGLEEIVRSAVEWERRVSAA